MPTSELPVCSEILIYLENTEDREEEGVMSACFQACEFKVTNQTQKSVEVQEVWALNLAVVFETMEMDSLQERDYGENRIL